MKRFGRIIKRFDATRMNYKIWKKVQLLEAPAINNQGRYNDNNKQVLSSETRSWDTRKDREDICSSSKDAR